MFIIILFLSISIIPHNGGVIKFVVRVAHRVLRQVVVIVRVFKYQAFVVIGGHHEMVVRG